MLVVVCIICFCAIVLFGSVILTINDKVNKVQDEVEALSERVWQLEDDCDYLDMIYKDDDNWYAYLSYVRKNGMEDAMSYEDWEKMFNCGDYHD